MLIRTLGKPFRKALAKKLATLIEQSQRERTQKILSRMANSPRNVKIDSPYRIINPEYIRMGNDIYLGPGSLLIAIKRYPGPEMHPPASVTIQTFSPKITIGDRVSSTGGLQLAALKEIRIEDDVMFATNVNVTDGLHGYKSADLPYKYQPMWQLAPIVIKKGCWIGHISPFLEPFELRTTCSKGFQPVRALSVDGRIS